MTYTYIVNPAKLNAVLRQKREIMIKHYITHYARDGKDYAEAWIQINLFKWCICLSKKRTVINELYANTKKH